MSLGRSRAFVLVGGLLLLAWGLVSLHRVFREERRDALDALSGEHDFLEVRARRELEARIEAALDASGERRAAALEDPRCPAQDLLDWQGGRQRLPRVFEHPGDESGPEFALEGLYDAVLEGSLEAGTSEEESPWNERGVLLATLRAAMLAGERASIEEAFRALLEHRVNWRIDTARDLGTTLAIVDFFVREGDPHPALLRRLFRERLKDGSGGELAPLGVQLLEARSRLTRADFEFLLRKALEVAGAAGVDLSDVAARAREESGENLRFEPSWFRASRVLWDGGSWFVEERSEDAWVGVAVDLGRVAVEVEEQLQDELGREFELEVRAPRDGGGLDELEVRASDAWGRFESAEIDQRYRLKSALLAFTALLALAMAGYSVRYQRRRARLVRLQSDFVAAVSHELKTPLASVRLLAETLERKLGGDPAARDYPARIVRAVDGLHFLVDNILSFNRLDQAPTPVRRETVVVSDLLDSVEASVSESVGRPLVLERQVEDGASVEADPGLLELVFVNLLRNAALYNDRPEVRVSVSIERDGGRTRLRVRDNGWGFPPEDRGKAFDRFWRGRDPARPKVAGTGLGLAICRMVVELHGGRIELEQSSEAGSTFRIELP